MPMLGGSGKSGLRVLQQADGNKHQSNPVSTTEYELLATTPDVVPVSFAVWYHGGTCTHMTLRAYVDGKTYVYDVSNPVDNQVCVPVCYADLADNAQALVADDLSDNAAVLLEALQAIQNMKGRSVKITVAVTWTVQVTDLYARVKYGVLR